MFIFLLENVKTFTIRSLKRNYCYLTLDTSLLSSDDDSEDSSKENSYSTSTKKYFYKVEKCFEKIAEKIEQKLRPNENLCLLRDQMFKN